MEPANAYIQYGVQTTGAEAILQGSVSCSFYFLFDFEFCFAVVCFMACQVSRFSLVLVMVSFCTLSCLCLVYFFLLKSPVLVLVNCFPIAD